MKFSIVIPTYNHCDDLLKPCVESVLKYTDFAETELIVSMNGCTDNTIHYVKYVSSVFRQMGLPTHFSVKISPEPLGYAGACNAGIRHAQGDAIVLLNNDAVLLEQPRNRWLEILGRPFEDADCGISSIIKSYSEDAGRSFAVFFCVAVRKAVFERIGFLNESYGPGGGEDIEFCIEAENAGFKVAEVFDKHWDGHQFTGGFPIWHKGEGTVHDETLVPDWNNIFRRNMLKIAKKYNTERYKFLLSNDYERAVFLKGDPVFSRESTRYEWAAKNIVGTKILEIGCSTGYGVQFLPNVDYLGLDYDPEIIEVAKEQEWGNAEFAYADINTYLLGYYDTIIAFEVIEHLKNGLQIVEKLKEHCKRLLITVPLNEPPGFWGHHHMLHGLNESHFRGAEFSYIDEHGNITSSPRPVDANNRCNLLICKW